MNDISIFKVKMDTLCDYARKIVYFHGATPYPDMEKDIRNTVESLVDNQNDLQKLDVSEYNNALNTLTLTTDFLRIIHLYMGKIYPEHAEGTADNPEEQPAEEVPVQKVKDTLDSAMAQLNEIFSTYSRVLGDETTINKETEKKIIELCHRAEMANSWLYELPDSKLAEVCASTSDYRSELKTINRKILRIEHMAQEVLYYD